MSESLTAQTAADFRVPIPTGASQVWKGTL
jgi:hypothetical protein